MRSQKGSILILTCLALLLLMGIAGIAVDVGRMYIGKNELQSFAEAAAMNGAMQLDKTSPGIQKAVDAVAALATGSHAMKWDMATKTVADIKTMFATGSSTNPDKPDPASWTENPKSPANYRFVRVAASAEVPSVFMQAFQHAANASTTVVAVAVAVQDSAMESATELELFSATAPNPDPISGPPRWGFQEGKRYSMNSRNADGASVLAARVTEDSDAISSEYSSYVTNGKGNGRRLMTLTIASEDGSAIGAGHFFLLTPDIYTMVKGSDPIRVEYVGPAAATGPSVRAAARLVQ